MKLYGNAALSWQGRRRLAELVVIDGCTVAAAAASAGVSVRCARKWVCRYRAEGELGLLGLRFGPAHALALTVSARTMRLGAVPLFLAAERVSPPAFALAS